MKGDQVVYEFGFPLVEANFNTALSQNGIDVPIQGDQTGNFLAAYGLNKPAELTKYAFTPYCYPPVLATSRPRPIRPRTRRPTRARACTRRRPTSTTPSSSSARRSRPTEATCRPRPSSRSSARSPTTGACGTYHTDTNHDLMHQVAMVSYANGINPGELAGTFTESPVPPSYFKS